MLNRRVLRIKVMQALYAFFQSEDERMDIAERNLLSSIDKFYDLYIYQLSIVIELVDFAKQRMEENKLKYLPTEADLNPNTKFIDNRFVKQLAENQNFRLKCNELKINWSEEQDMFRQLYNAIKESAIYEKYARSTDSFPYESDKKFALNMYRRFIILNDTVHNYFEDKNIHWADDFYDVAYVVLKTIEEYKQEYGANHSLPELFRNDEISTPESDIDFIKHLFRKTIIHSKEFEELIANKANNWDVERIAIVDIILLKMALTEITEFPSIPLKVTMNEYIDISKEYSSEKSKVFINGVLDKMIVDLVSENKVHKTARGMIEE